MSDLVVWCTRRCVRRILMTANGWLRIGVFFALVLLSAKPWASTWSGGFQPGEIGSPDGQTQGQACADNRRHQRDWAGSCTAVCDGRCEGCGHRQQPGDD